MRSTTVPGRGCPRPSARRTSARSQTRWRPGTASSPRHGRRRWGPRSRSRTTRRVSAQACSSTTRASSRTTRSSTSVGEMTEGSPASCESRSGSRGDHPVERPSRPALLQGRGRTGRRLHCRLEAGSGDADGRVHPGRVHRGRGPPAGSVQRDSGRARGGRLPHQASRDRQDRLHRKHGRRRQDRRSRCRALHAGQPGAWRKIRRAGARRRGGRGRPRKPRALLHAHHGPGLLRLDSRSRAQARKAELLEAYVDAVRSIQVGDPFEPATQMGPLTMARQLERVQGYIQRASRKAPPW